MSIFKGDSIYKSGGGGGGFNNGGELVDGEFIAVENNTISSYDNVSRDPINLYFEPKDGEVLNAVVELTTAVNATVNVYVVKNGFLYLLGNVGGDTVTAGNDYKINITGDSYAIENVSIPNPDPEFASLMGSIYKLVKIDNLLFLGSNFSGDTGQYVKQNGTTYYLPRSVKNLNVNGFVIPDDNDITKIETLYPYPNTGLHLKSTSGWRDGGNGDNLSGMDFKPLGYYSNYTQDITTHSYFYFKINGDNNLFYRYVCRYNDNVANASSQSYVVNAYYNLRLVLRT